ncbi:unnamed protein product [Psylliodes chrysocephalus]|uniref:Uncharacterized protein n=1 Tax=Psylliodes chrysocephalus TaxID=3402493 RepID=A0A9P0GCJ9_9CUCU|nr:unnamed protein product [Psylliodes chrysocephala]
MASEKKYQDVNIFDDLFVSDSSDELYSSYSELSSSENEEIPDIQPINSNAGPSTEIEPISNAGSSSEIETRKRKRSSITWWSRNVRQEARAQSLEEVEKKTERLQQDRRPSKRNFTLLYFLYNEMARKKGESTRDRMCPNDKRGRHGHRTKVSIDAIAITKKDIGSFPSYISHYSRSHTDKKYLSQDLNIAKMYRLYKEEGISRKIQPQLESFYRNIFVDSFNLSFHHPSNDTCVKCDK